MKKISVIRETPVPSCSVNRLIWNKEKERWSFEYLVTIPEDVELDESGNFSKSLFVYGHIQQLLLVSSVTKNSINIEVSSIDDVVYLIALQYREDIRYREKWIANNPNYYDEIFQIEVKNETQISKYSNIIFIKSQNKDTTIFAAAPQKGVDE